MLRFDVQGHVSFCSMPLLKRLSVDVMHTPDALHPYLARPAAWLSGPPSEWPAQLPTLVFRARDQGELYLRGWLRQDGTGWYMQLLDVSDLVQEVQQGEAREELLSQAWRLSSRLAGMSALQLESASSDWLEALAVRLRVPWAGLYLAESKGVRLYQSLAVNKGVAAQVPDERALATQLAESLHRGSPVRGRALAGAHGDFWVVPCERGADVEAWLVLAEFDPSRAVTRLSEQDWQQLVGWFVVPLQQEVRAQARGDEQRRLDVLQQLLGAGWWEYRLADRYLTLADGLRQQLGLVMAPEQLVMKDWQQVIDPADRELFSLHWNAALEALAPLNLSLRLSTPDGLRWYRLQGELVGSGRQRRLIGHALEVDDVKQLEGEAAMATARLNSLLETAPAFIYVQQCVEGALHTSYCSESLRAVLGWTLEELQNLTLSACVHEEDRARFLARTRQLLQEGSARGRYRIIDSAGRYHWLLDEARVLRDEKGLPTEVVGLFMDVTEAAEAAEQVRESEERYRALVEDAPALICRYQPNLNLTFSNRTMDSVLAQLGAASDPRNLGDYMAAEQREQFLQRLAALTPDSPISVAEVRLDLPGQRHAWLVWAERGLFDATGRLIEVQAVGRDNTEVHRTRQQLYQSAKMATLGEMSAGLAHEINQPLNVMRMAVANLTTRQERGLLTSEALLEKLQRIDSQITSAAKIVDHVRVFGRRSDVDGSAFDPGAAIDGALSMVSEGFEKRGIRTRLAVDALPMVQGHGDQLEQVLINLMLNAQYALGKHKEHDPALQPCIQVRAWQGDAAVLIDVEDNAGGIPGDVLERVFEPFFTTKPAGEGTGLGLSVSYGIIKQMGGDLRVCNVRGGACFTLELPLRDPQPQPPETGAGATDGDEASTN